MADKTLEADAALGPEYEVIGKAISLCGGEDSSGLRRALYAVWQTDIQSEKKRKIGPAWTPQGSAAVQRTLLACGQDVERNPDLVEKVGKLIAREIEIVKRETQ